MLVFFVFRLKEVVNIVGVELMGGCPYLDLCTVEYLLDTLQKGV